MNKRKVVLLITTLMVASTLGGCATKNSSTVAKKAPVIIKFFTGKVETVDIVNNMINKFNSENPGIVVEQEFQKDASNVIKIKFASGDIPDITTVVTQDYIDQGKYMDISGETAWWSRVQPSIKQMCTDVKTGKQYEIASNMTNAGIFYNKKIFNDLGLKPATTWEEFESNLMTIKEKDPKVVPMFVGGNETWMLGQMVDFMAHGLIKQKFGPIDSKKAFINNDNSKLQFAAAGGPIDVFAKRLLELKSAGLFNSDFLTATYADQQEAFATGKAAVISQGLWAVAGILADNKNMKDIGFSPYPSIVDGTKPVVLSAEDSLYAITAASKHKEDDIKFLNYMFKPENLKIYSEAVNEPSAFTDVNANWGPLKDEVSNALKEGVNIDFTPTPSGFSDDDAGSMIQDLYAGKYNTTLDFAKDYKATWDKAWNATNTK